MRLRRGRTGWRRGRRAVAAGLIVMLAGVAGACAGSPTDTTEQSPAPAAAGADLSLGLGDLTEGLGLTDDQREAVREVLEGYRGQAETPGTLWYVAADLQEIFTADQIVAIETRGVERRAQMNSHRRDTPPPGPDMQGRRGDRVRDGQGFGGGRGLAGLDLSEEQMVRLREIRESHAPQMEEIRDALRDGSLTREDAEVRLEAIRDAIHQEMQGVLTPEQLTVFEKQRAEAETRREEARSQREARRQAEHSAMVAALGLTPEQVAAIDALMERPEGEGRPSPEGLRARRTERHQALLGILDDDQEQTWVLHHALSAAFRGGQPPTGPGAGRRGEGSHGGQGVGGFSRGVGNGFRGPASRT
jgi:Spy/CpxP family protein refolding chaperone